MTITVDGVWFVRSGPAFISAPSISENEPVLPSLDAPDLPMPVSSSAPSVPLPPWIPTSGPYRNQTGPAT